MDDKKSVEPWSPESRALFDVAMARWPSFDIKKSLKYYITKSTELRWEDFLEAIRQRDEIKGFGGDAAGFLVEQARRMILEAESEGLTSLLGGSSRSIALEYLEGTRAFQDIPRSRVETSCNVIDSILAELRGRGVDIWLSQEPAAGQVGHVSGTLPAFVGVAVGSRLQRSSPWTALSTSIILLVLMLMIQTLIYWNDVREGICDINSRLSPSYTLADARKFVRTRLCGAPAAFVRIVSRDNVNLRSAPGMKSDVITQLPKGLAVAVVSRDDRDWLEVSFERDGHVIEGWVSRKYLARVR